MKSLSVTIQMKATEQYFPVVVFITLRKVSGSNFWVLCMKSKMWKLTDKYFPVVCTDQRGG